MEQIRPSDAQHVLFNDAEATAIREQLERLLANPLFKHSKRYPNLLKYVVDHTLAGDPSDLKERTLGVEVFGREPHYDTNADPIVRTTAGEIRKRIAQYYHEPGHENEIRIDLPPGSYVPEFSIPSDRRPAAPPPPVVIPAVSWLRHWVRYAAAGAALVAIVAAALWLKPWTSARAIDMFWAPVLDSTNAVLICVGQRQFLGSSPESQQQDSTDIPRAESALTGSANPITVSELYYLGSQNIAIPDVITIARMAGLLDSNHKSYQIRGQSSTTLADLRSGPVVLIGAFNNDWTLRLMGQLRYGFARDGKFMWIRDRQQPTNRDRAVSYDLPYLKLTKDYALISRILDPTTERMVVVVAGLTGYGTTAAGEFLTNPTYLDPLGKAAPRGWASKNIQIIIETSVINGNSGPPRIVDYYLW